jgi:AraC-like DNA-binding protein
VDALGHQARFALRQVVHPDAAVAVDDRRQALALGYVRDPGLSLLDIAYLLGFSEQSAFQRAFKRWTGAKGPRWARRKIRPQKASSAYPKSAKCY